MVFKSSIQALLKQNYDVSRSYHRMRLWAEGLGSDDKIVIYTVSKVGSNTVWKSLKMLNLEPPLYHVHVLRPEAIERGKQKNRADFAMLRYINPETVQAEYLQNQLSRAGSDHKPWSVITLIRDPIARISSEFFQKLEDEIAFGRDYRKRIQAGDNEQVVEEVIERFFKEHLDDPDAKDPFWWFELELKRILKVDVFAYPAIAGQNYQIYNGALANVLLLKLESLESCYQSAFQEFLGLPNLDLTQHNVASKKRYKQLYKDFLQKVVVPTDYLDKIYGAASVRHFYSEAAIGQFYRRWRGEG